MKILKFNIVIASAILIVGAIVAFVIPSNNTSPPVKKKYSIVNTWKLPKILKEISGIAWLSKNTIVAVQDEDGILFIYDLKKSNIVEQIRFAGFGDYEGIAIYNKDAYVMRSDGVLYEVLRFRESDKKISKFKTAFSSKNDIESLTLDIKNRHLITTPKAKDLQDNSFKGLYHIPIDSKQMDLQPKISIDMNDDALKAYKKKKIYETFSPSDIVIHPKTGEYYVLEGKRPKLMILNREGVIKKVIKLKSDDFPQPEGITFSPQGTLYISTEAKGGSAAIMEVVLD